MNVLHVLLTHTKMRTVTAYAMTFGMKTTAANGAVNVTQNAYTDVLDLLPVTVHFVSQTVIEILKIHVSVIKTGEIQVVKHMWDRVIPYVKLVMDQSFTIARHVWHMHPSMILEFVSVIDIGLNLTARNLYTKGFVTLDAAAVQGLELRIVLSVHKMHLRTVLEFAFAMRTGRGNPAVLIHIWEHVTQSASIAQVQVPESVCSVLSMRIEMLPAYVYARHITLVQTAPRRSTTAHVMTTVVLNSDVKDPLQPTAFSASLTQAVPRFRVVHVIKGGEENTARKIWRLNVIRRVWTVQASLHMTAFRAEFIHILLKESVFVTIIGQVMNAVFILLLAILYVMDVMDPRHLIANTESNMHPSMQMFADAICRILEKAAPHIQGSAVKYVLLVLDHLMKNV